MAMKKLPKISVYKWAIFSHTPTSGWYVGVLNIFLSREYSYYKMSVSKYLFCFSYSKRDSGITKDDQYWRDTTITLELFFIRIFKFTRIKSLEPIDFNDDLD